MNYPYLAAGYYPISHTRDDVVRDLDNMKSIGIEVVRTAEICCAWDQIEPEKGRFDLEWLDDFFDLCEARNMQILLGTGTACPPYWLRTHYPDVGIVSAGGNKYPNNASYSWACFDHPGFKEEAERYIATIVNRYKNRKGLFGYQIHNEVGFPFMPLESGEMEIYCYCQHSVKAFQSWLENRYSSIEELNTAYRWNATNERYTSFDQVEPPKAAPKAWSSVTRWLDWRLFWMDNTTAFVAWQNDIIKQYDCGHPTTTNTFFMKSQDPFGVRMGLDQLGIAQSVDFLGIDIYPGSGNKAVKKPECSSMCLDMGRTIANYCGKDYALLETESGPINGWVMGPDRNVKGSDIWRNLFDAYGHGAKFALFQGYRDWDYQPLQWGGLTDLDGNPTERSQTVKEIYGILNDSLGSLPPCINRPADVAIVLSKENAILIEGTGQEKFLLDSYRGIYSALWNRNIRTDILTTDMLSEQILANYKLVCLPLLAVLSDENASLFENYVKNGGCVFAGARVGMLNSIGWRNHQMPCRPLDKVFGVNCVETDAGINPNVLYRNQEFTGFWHKEHLDLIDTAVVEAEFQDGTPAFVHNYYGKGQAFYEATHSAIGLIRDGSNLLPAFLGRILEATGIVAECSMVTESDNQIFDCHLFPNAGNTALVITSRADCKWNADKSLVRFQCRYEPIGIKDMLTGEDIPFKKTNADTYEIAVQLNTETANIFLILK